jgi:hypothetical protein
VINALKNEMPNAKVVHEKYHKVMFLVNFTNIFSFYSTFLLIFNLNLDKWHSSLESPLIIFYLRLDRKKKRMGEEIREGVLKEEISEPKLEG